MAGDPVVKTKLTYAEYLAAERKSDVKLEYLRGEVWAMAGGAIEHGRLVLNVGAELRRALAGKRCVAFGSEVKIRVVETDRSTYPDASVVCGKQEIAVDDEHAITNPTVLVEVLSDSTEASDRGEKFAHYRRLASFQEYVLVSQTSPRIEVFRRDGATWVAELRASRVVRSG